MGHVDDEMKIDLVIHVNRNIINNVNKDVTIVDIRIIETVQAGAVRKRTY